MALTRLDNNKQHLPTKRDKHPPVNLQNFNDLVDSFQFGSVSLTDATPTEIRFARRFVKDPPTLLLTQGIDSLGGWAAVLITNIGVDKFTAESTGDCTFKYLAIK